MAIHPLTTWRSTLASLPKVADNSWAQNFADWYAARIAGITTAPASLVPTGFVFTFPTATFKTKLQALGPSPTALAGITAFATAWSDCMSAIAYPATLTLATGTFKPPTSNTTLFSAVTSVTIVPASITAGKNKIIELATAALVSDPNLSEFPVKFRDATLLLKITVVGSDSTPTPSGPLPLTVANVPLI